MFRKMTRIKQQLDEKDCIEILKNEKRGVLSVLGDDGYPYGIPLNHFFNEEAGKLYFHSGKAGHKIDAIRRCEKASFCVIDEGEREDGEWALRFRSVVVFGKIEFIEDRQTVYELSARLSRKFTDDEEYTRSEIEKYGPATLMFALEPEYISGKTVKES